MKKNFLITMCFVIVSCFLGIAHAGVKIVVLGSSTAQGSGVADSNNAWVNQYRAYLQSIDPTSQVINLAKGGYTTWAIMPTGTPGYQAGEHLLVPDTERNITQALSLNPNAIIINMPTNDVSNGVPVETQMENFATIINMAATAGVETWITTSQPHNFGEAYAGPYGNGTEPNGDKQGARNKFKQLTENILATYGERAIDFYTDIATEDGYSFIRPGYDSGDGVHLNDAAHTILFEQVKAKNIPAEVGDTAWDGVLANPVYINFGSDSGVEGWNDITSRASGSSIDVIYDSTNLQTSLSMTITTGFTNGSSTNGNSSSIWGMTDAISASNFNADNVDPIIMFTGLNPNLAYEFAVYGSRNSSASRETTYTFIGKNTGAATLETALNTENIVTIPNISPDEFGRIELIISKGANNNQGYVYISAMKITSSTPVEELPEGAINVETAGTLSSLLPTPTDTITTLVLYGKLNSTDIKIIRELPALKYLNMKKTSIYRGGDAYLNGMNTVDNVFPKEMFYNNTVIEEVIVPETVTELAYHAFMGCSSLKKVVMFNSVNVFGNDLFSGCANLEEVTMPTEMTTINSGCFYGCKKLKSINIPHGIEALNGSIFYNCNAIEVINLPSTIKTMNGDWIFSYCHALKEITLPSTLESMMGGIFYNCWSLDKIICKAENLPAINTKNGTTPFAGAFKPEYCTLKVPFTSYEKYKNDESVWGIMNIIEPIEAITIDGNTSADPTTPDALKTASTLTISGGTPLVDALSELLADNTQITSIDLSGITEDFGMITTGNPNCLIVAPSGATLEQDNVIIDGKAKSIQLTDAMPFSSPITFVAEEISYTRNLGTEGKPSGIGEAKGWSTITLPFAPTSISATNKLGQVVELASYDENEQFENGKCPFWLRKITESGFVNTATLNANTPYIICFPNNEKYNDQYNITGEVSFTAEESNVVITPDFTAQTGNEYDITSTLASVAQSEDAYAINEEGTAFEKNVRIVNPFECFVTAKANGPSPARFLIGNNGATNLNKQLMKEDNGNSVYTDGNSIIVECETSQTISLYDISGKLIIQREVEAGKNRIENLEKGIYIINNQKVVL